MQMKCNSKNASAKKVIGYAVYYIFAAILACYFLLPFFVLVTRSFMEVEEVGQTLLPSSLYLKNYLNIFEFDKGIDIFKALLNSLTIMFFKTLGTVVSSFICAYSLSRIKFFGRKFLFSFGMMTIMLPGIVTTITLYSLYYKINWIGTLYPLIVPAWFGGGMMTIFLEMQFIKSISNTMDEAAIIDGANHLQIAFGIYLPLITPVIIYVAITTAIGSWNDFMAPLTYITKGSYEYYTLPLAFYYKYQSAGGVDPSITRPNEQAALGIFMMLPVFILFAFFKDKMIKGISLNGGIKG